MLHLHLFENKMTPNELKDVSNDRLVEIISEQNNLCKAYKMRSVELKAANRPCWYEALDAEIPRIADYLLILEQERKARML